MNKTAIFTFAVIAICSCSRQQVKIAFEKECKITPFTDLISSIELIPLESNGTHRLSPMSELDLSGSDYILTDSNSVLRYSPEGKLLEDEGKRPANEKFQTRKVKEGILAYFGYGKSRPYRAALIKQQDTVKFLQNSAKVLNLSAEFPVFSAAKDGGTILIDSFSPTIYEYDRGKLNPHLSFDFGKYAIPESFFEGNDPYVAAEMLFSREFALITRYFEKDKYKFVEIHLQNPMKTDFYYGIARNEKWHWFYAGKAGKDPLPSSFKLFDNDDCLISIISSEAIGFLPDPFRRLVRNPDVLKSAKKNGNSVIAKIKMR